MTSDFDPKKAFFTVTDELLTVDNIIESAVQNTEVRLISEAASHIILSGGKRIRPALALLSARICGYSGKKTAYLGASIELIHTASLIHDDVLDNADLRRGSPTANAKWGNHLSVLVGDFLLSIASELLSQHTSTDIISILTRAAKRTTEGEILETIKSNDLDIGVDDYLKIIEMKTAHLFSAACHAGAVLAEAPLKLTECLCNYGNNIGMAFQIIDDILDLTSESTFSGKRKGTDLREGKLTLPLIYTLKECNKGESDIIKESLFASSYAEDSLNKILQILNKYNSIHMAQKVADKYVSDAITSISAFKESIEKDSLISIANLVPDRRD